MIDSCDASGCGVSGGCGIGVDEGDDASLSGSSNNNEKMIYDHRIDVQTSVSHDSHGSAIDDGDDASFSASSNNDVSTECFTDSSCVSFSEDSEWDLEDDRLKESDNCDTMSTSSSEHVMTTQYTSSTTQHTCNTSTTQNQCCFCSGTYYRNNTSRVWHNKPTCSTVITCQNCGRSICYACVKCLLGRISGKSKQDRWYKHYDFILQHNKYTAEFCHACEIKQSTKGNTKMLKQPQALGLYSGALFFPEFKLIMLSPKQGYVDILCEC